MPDSISTIATKWGTAIQKLSDVLGREPAANRPRREVVLWCNLVAERNDELTAIANVAQDLGFTMPSNDEVQASVAKAAERLEALGEDVKKVPNRGRKNNERDEEVIVENAEDGANNTHDQSGDGDSRADFVSSAMVSGAEVFNAQGVAVGAWKKGEVHYYQPCMACTRKPRTTCRGALGAPCTPCRRTGLTTNCSFMSRGNESTPGPSSQTPNARKRSRETLAASASTSSVDDPTPEAEEVPEPVEQQPKKLRTGRHRKKSGTSAKEYQALQYADLISEDPVIAAESPPPTFREARSNSTMKKASTSTTTGSISGKDKEFVSNAVSVTPRKVTSTAEGTVKVADEVEAIWSQVETLQDEVGALRDELSIERERNSVQREQSAMLQKQVADLALELEWLRRTTTV
ncbi:hypothetical protein BOTBODRAFT_57979 [Botryobasidium botryosum FD-172 SS1]|uniref:Uncharacterized protein n=1 Tax=Botryobasidium botryosum (strain FD-172 SS1) TaxID=930990 RepID=A0A067M4U9_BOTB1|nr:hypothetical protein BOTBODRAFT_57979 [Botryobasidium botryosum FD-172 SS1]